MIWVVLTVMEDKTPGLRGKSKLMKNPLETIIRCMVDSVNGNRPLSGFEGRVIGCSPVTSLVLADQISLPSEGLI